MDTRIWEASNPRNLSHATEASGAYARDMRNGRELGTGWHKVRMTPKVAPKIGCPQRIAVTGGRARLDASGPPARKRPPAPLPPPHRVLTRRERMAAGNAR